MEGKKRKLIFLILLVAIGAIICFFRFYNKGELRVEIIALKYPARVEFLADRNILTYLKDSPQKGKTNDHLNYWYLLQIHKNSGVKKYYFNSPGFLYDPLAGKEIAASPQLRTFLEGHLAEVVMENPFGLIMPWEEVDKLFPKMAKGRLRDLETGLTFNIQRRGGTAHADIQPLTAQDTAVFKSIYGGRWSWKRRAAILEVDGFHIAASMNGMPHGQGAITGNNFPGHSCLHFYETKTHSGNVDLAHQLMVWKSAGQIEDYLQNKSPREIVEIALTAIGQNDPQLVTMVFVLNEETSKILDYMDKIASLKIHSIIQGQRENEYGVKIEWYEVESGKNYKREFNVYLVENKSNYLIRADEVINNLIKNE